MDTQGRQSPGYNIGQTPDYDIGTLPSQPERSSRSRMIRIGGRVLDLYTVADTAIRVTLSAVALTGTLHASSSHEAPGRPDNTATNSSSPLDERDQIADVGSAPVNANISNTGTTGATSNTNETTTSNTVTVSSNVPASSQQRTH